MICFDFLYLRIGILLISVNLASNTVAASCSYEGVTYDAGKKFASKDCEKSCECLGNGIVHCVMMCSLPPPCPDGLTAVPTTIDGHLPDSGCQCSWHACRCTSWLSTCWVSQLLDTDIIDVKTHSYETFGYLYCDTTSHLSANGCKPNFCTIETHYQKSQQM